MFFWAAAPYWSTWVESVMSIFWAKSLTTLRSASLSWLSSSWMAWASRAAWTAAASSGVTLFSRVRDGASGALGTAACASLAAAAAAAEPVGSRVSSGIMFISSLMGVFLRIFI